LPVNAAAKQGGRQLKSDLPERHPGQFRDHIGGQRGNGLGHVQPVIRRQAG